MNKRVLSLLSASMSIFFLFSGLLSGGARFKKEKLNLLLISIDTLRPDYLSCYGGEKVQTKAIDSLTNPGILFRRSLAHNPLTLPSHINILAGVTPLIHGVHENLGFRLSGDALTLAELYHLGLALLKVNRPKEALIYLERYLEIVSLDSPDREKILQLVNYLKSHD